MISKQKILIISDKKENMEALHQTLQELQVELVEMIRGSNPFVSIPHQNFALAILDIMTSVKDMFELIENLRHDKAPTSLPIFIISPGETDEEYLHKGYAAGCVDYIVKPYVPKILLAKSKIFLEIDRQKQELQWQRDHLEELVIERSQDLLEELSSRQQLQAQLHQAQKMESLGHLAGGVAHDFNNMLSVILCHAELAMMNMKPDDPALTSLQEIRKAADRSTDLSRQLLAFARKQAITPKVLDLNITVEGMLKMLQRLIGENIDLAWLPTAELWPVKVDPGQIDQILANLCINARDAINGAGKVIIQSQNVTLHADDCSRRYYLTPGDYVLLVVSDTGCGMSREILGRVFEPFFTTKELGQGTGIGLATVYGIVKQNHGFIDVDSEPGQGTTFRIYLPRQVEEGQINIELAAKQPLTEQGNETILLVEDEAAILNVAKLLLQGLGYTVLSTTSAQEALNLAREKSDGIQLLLTDIVMPEMNGIDLARELKKIYPELKCLFMSGYIAEKMHILEVEKDENNFIQKPFSLKGLAEKVREVLSAGGD